MTVKINDTLKRITDSLNSVEKDDLYRYLRCDYVRQDIEDYCVNEDINIPEDKYDEIIDTAVTLYVYDGKYDCNLSYWENISNLIDRAKEIHNVE